MKKYCFSFLFLLLSGCYLSAGETAPPARSVIEIWVWGGPSQLETFDPKPKAPKEYNNGYKEY